MPLSWIGAFLVAIYEPCLALEPGPFWGEVQDSGIYLGLRLRPFRDSVRAYLGFAYDMGACHSLTPGPLQVI